MLEAGKNRATDNVALGITWDDEKRGRVLSAVLALIVAATIVVPVAAGAKRSDGLVSVIVRALPRSGDAAERAVRSVEGSVGRRLAIIDGLSAQVPASSLPILRTFPGIHSVTPDRRVRLLHEAFDPQADPGSMVNTAQVVGARDMWRNGFTGKGIDVALIDTGVVPVKGLTVSGKVVNGPDLSFESQADSLRHLDTYGHGTHLAGIIAGRDEEVGTDQLNADHKNFMGIAPYARLVSIKVANTYGVTDVSQVIAAIDWVVQHRRDNGLDIRVLNLSFGTDGTQDYRFDPLAYAAEVAWRKGIVVVTAAGNSGFGNAKLNNPAYDPYLIAVGATDTKGTYSTADDIVPSWSSRGDGTRNPDLVAPGKSIVSLRDPGSYIDVSYPNGHITDRFFRGSGTSQAAAVVAGAAALLIQQRPGITPDQVKAILMSSATRLPDADPTAQGAGEMNLRAAMNAQTPVAVQTWQVSNGLGSLEQARGSVHVQDEGRVELRGEQDIFGRPWDGLSWSANCWLETSWAGGDWNGVTWSGSSWNGLSWSGMTWSGMTWSGMTWSGMTWSGMTWSGMTWSGMTWSGMTWSGLSWSGVTWSAVEWK
jgi:subtilisin family serine protease